MNNQYIQEITISYGKSNYGNSYIDDDILLCDEFSKVPLPTSPRRMGCALLALCLEGKAYYTVNTERHAVGPNDLIIISEGQVLGDYQLSGDCQGIAIMITEDNLRETMAGIKELSALFLFSRFHPVFKLQQKEVDAIKDYFWMIKRKIDDTENLFRHDIVRLLMSALIADFCNAVARIQQMNDKRKTRPEVIFSQFIRLVEQNFRTERRVSWYSSQLNITSKYLSETVKHVSHRTPNEWIDNYVTLEMRVLLKNSNKSIKQIATELNFPNQSFLGKYFKEHVGLSPSEYRRK
ncbi:MAG: AraC family transcriptional regulator [Prevotella sp.]|nr:AraC family transcriptional regulator [Prevotella sp.]